MTFFRVFLVGVFCTVFTCSGFADGGFRTTVAGNGGVTTTTGQTSGSGTGGGINTDKCTEADVAKKTKCGQAKGVGVCSRVEGRPSCVMSSCKEPYYIEYKNSRELETSEGCRSGEGDGTMVEGWSVCVSGNKHICRTEDAVTKLCSTPSPNGWFNRKKQEGEPKDWVANVVSLNDGTKVIAGCKNINKSVKKCKTDGESAEILDQYLKTCVPCKKCDPDVNSANCKLVGSDGNILCHYETSCKDGFDKEQHRGEYNPSCSPKPRTKCTDKELKDLGAEQGEFKEGKCVAVKCESNTAFIKEGKCVECEPCNATNATCELSVKNNECVYTTKCMKDFVDIKNDGKPNASCSPKAPDEYNISYNLDGGSGCEDAPRKYTKGKAIEVKCTPAKNGFNFMGWCDGENCTPTIKITAQDTGDKTFVAQWTVVEAVVDVKCPTDEDKAKHPNADSFEVVNDVCLPKDCKTGYHLEGEKPSVHCVENTPDEQECPTAADKEKYPHADKFELVENECKPTHCEDGYKLDEDTNQCEEKARTECTDEEKEKFPHADRFEFKDGVCKPIHCEKGYKLEGGECVDDGIKEAEDNYKAAKETETSFENRMLGGATMAATGIGGMELAQGLAEQSADAAAERDMTAYLATFQCKVGDKRYSGGTNAIETPGANQLMNLYQEYVELAADLKERKAALGMKSGIESEVVLDKANTGLYDDVGHGIENGTYASLYRASMGNENDIKKLQEQKETSANRVKGGAIAAGAGVVGGIVGNIAINGGNSKKNESEIKEKADSTTKLANSILELNNMSGSGFTLNGAEAGDLMQSIRDKFK